jgi:hypothetical protein
MVHHQFMMLLLNSHSSEGLQQRLSKTFVMKLFLCQYPPQTQQKFTVNYLVVADWLTRIFNPLLSNSEHARCDLLTNSETCE